MGHRQKYPEVVRDFCLMVHHQSVRTYESIRAYFKNNLPHTRTIRGWYSNSDMNCQPGIDSTCLRILKKIADRKRAAGKELLVSVVFDEIHIRKLFQWCISSRTMYGYPTYGSEFCQKLEDEELAATQAIVYMVCGINERVQIPICYHFIKTLKAEQRRDLITQIIDSLIAINVKVVNICFDGLFSNRKMCALLGANLDVFSERFQPYFIASNGDKIRIMLDVCHMEKLIRGVIGTQEVIYDESNRKIEWKFYENLLKYNKQGYGLTHKVTREHIYWKERKMNVKLAAQLLSRSTSNSIEFLQNKGFKDFKDAEATIAFTRLFNDLFDIFNSKSDKHRNPLKRPLCKENKNEIFGIFNSAIEIIKRYKIIKNFKIKTLVKSSLQTGFKGFIINMYSAMSIFEEYVEEKGLLTSIPTYHPSQDPLEIFFGKIRTFGVANTNPSCQQFQSAYRKLLVYSTVCTSKRANCYNYEIISEPFSNILFITSRRPTINSLEENDDCLPEELEEVHAKLIEIEQRERCSLVDYQIMDVSIAYAAKVIENRIDRPHRMYCDTCAKVFIQNKKLTNILGNSQFESPCISTYIICREVDRFLKIELLRGDLKFSTVYCAILEQVDVANLFTATDFSHHHDHKLYLIRAIIDTYIQIKGTYIAKRETFAIHKKSIRQKLNKLIHFYGQ